MRNKQFLLGLRTVFVRTAEDARQSGFLGIRLLSEDQYHYGWIRAEVGAENRLVIRDFAFESSPGKAILAGFVPEPHGVGNVAILFVAIAIRARRMGRP